MSGRLTFMPVNACDHCRNIKISSGSHSLLVLCMLFCDKIFKSRASTDRFAEGGAESFPIVLTACAKSSNCSSVFFIEIGIFPEVISFKNLRIGFSAERYWVYNPSF